MVSKLLLGKSETLDLLIMRIDDITSPRADYQKLYVRDKEGDEVKVTSFLGRLNLTLPAIKKLTLVAEEYKSLKTYRVIAITDSEVSASEFKAKTKVTKKDYKEFISLIKGLRESLQAIVWGVISRDKDFKTIPLNPLGEEFSNPSGMLEATIRLVKLCNAYPDDTLDKQLMIAAASLYFIGASNYITQDGVKTKSYHLLGPTYGLIQKFDSMVSNIRSEGKEVNPKETTLLLHILLGANDIMPSTPEAICVQRLAKTVTETEKAVKALAFLEDGSIVDPGRKRNYYYVKAETDESR